ncbi:sulfur carrier protein ThiS [Dethiobacter alkaliphilus]|uniref:Thiamine biosynthesis protein ThiS n=1 Tax=Dethiobacter alkaliphilus AHT 1 TaxID=555088 RepID=C0GEC8_DETAL|nr:sulfur carrier protein ThiS [Dethiobacter alkaliphilus]EEG78422.1 thiamine biosynthesis protein ThiS [Dethiobacter alkaliphilus AHT 1]
MIINGTEKDFPEGITVAKLLEELSLDPNKVVVEVDQQIVPKDEYRQKKLSSTAAVELISFVGGG